MEETYIVAFIHENECVYLMTQEQFENWNLSPLSPKPWKGTDKNKAIQFASQSADNLKYSFSNRLPYAHK